jgi:CubicO group peptidase (beta-lactamase class C family)
VASVSKVVTAAALGLAIGRGEVALDDPVAAHLPGWFVLPGGRSILVQHLATHTSGLPSNVDDPGRGVDVRSLAGSLTDVALLSRPGQAFRYSNTGIAILGAMLGFAAGRPYSELIRQRVCTPLTLPDITTELTAEQQDRLAPGHDDSGAPVATPTYPAGAPSGGFYGTAGDLLTFLAAHLCPPEGPLGAALRLAVRPQLRTADATLGLCWHIDDLHGTTRVWKNGGLPGYRCHVAMAGGVGVVVLSNTSRAIDDRATALLGDIMQVASLN